LDVRSPAEFEAAHIDGSRLAPLGSLHVEEIREAFDVTQPIHVVCESGARAAQAVRKFDDAGLDSGVVLAGGIQAWQAQAFSLNLGKETMGLERQVRITAGLMIVVGALLGFFVNPLWHILPAFIGAGLTLAGLTNTCAMGMLIAKMPWNQRGVAAKQCAISTPS